MKEINWKHLNLSLRTHRVHYRFYPVYCPLWNITWINIEKYKMWELSRDWTCDIMCWNGDQFNIKGSFILDVSKLCGGVKNLSQIWNLSWCDHTKLYICWKWRWPLKEDDLKTLKMEYLCNHFTNSSNKDDLQWKMTLNIKSGISQYYA